MLTTKKNMWNVPESHSAKRKNFGQGEHISLIDAALLGWVTLVRNDKNNEYQIGLKLSHRGASKVDIIVASIIPKSTRHMKQIWYEYCDSSDVVAARVSCGCHIVDRVRSTGEASEKWLFTAINCSSYNFCSVIPDHNRWDALESVKRRVATWGLEGSFASQNKDWTIPIQFLFTSCEHTLVLKQYIKKGELGEAPHPCLYACFCKNDDVCEGNEKTL